MREDRATLARKQPKMTTVKEAAKRDGMGYIRGTCLIVTEEIARSKRENGAK